ncbi:hypothetical protein HK105_209400 [Polyrhizophydium stewartii]|uniref:COX assembly mitochondrial protein n=1 Tax=Polyrhizophydium stewartii TaxID=2732419 RepID=A0ABR4MV52_9FUNG|nr:hypothetical protein HK105_000983 [Polyrhizophydium stewartii]
MTESRACGAEKADFKWCAKAEGFLGRMLGKCDELQRRYEACLDHEFQIRRKKNLENGRERAAKWKDANRELGL